MGRRLNLVELSFPIDRPSGDGGIGLDWIDWTIGGGKRDNT